MEYRQTTFESCLAVCLLRKLKTGISRREELACLDRSLRRCRGDFVWGHVEFVTDSYAVKVQRVVDNARFQEFLEKTGYPWKVECESITRGWIDRHVANQPLVLLDDFSLRSAMHCPHWITVCKSGVSSYVIFDPWEGKEVEVSKAAIAEGIRLLREHLLMCPQALILREP